ncbi:MAG: glutamate synthase subunit beta [Acidobacteriaceae bacterium]|jgi:glutamate synthase (NADPH/NADH) small chain|nr:glutamate synthase subunit beta [Acidobacteriaceae bacterium]
MGKVTGFIDIQRLKQPARPVNERVHDWREVYLPYPEQALTDQASRCMDCGIPFCHQGCPLGNLIPDWNDLVYRDRRKAAIDRLHATNNFPEFTGRVCPAPCEGACVLGIHSDPVTIKSVEASIIDRAWDEGWVVATPPETRTGRSIAVIGSGPAGLATAAQLNRAGHTVTVFERDDRIGGLLRYGIPEFKMEKRILERRLTLMAEEGIVFKTGVNAGVDVPIAELKARFDAVVITTGATRPRDLPVPGRELKGIHFAMEYLTQQNRRNEGDDIAESDFISATGKHVVIIGGGDTGADCLGTALRQGAASVRQLELLPQPPASRAEENPWPLWPNIFRVSTAHEEGGERAYSIATKKFSGNARGEVTMLHASTVNMVSTNGRVEFVPVNGSDIDIKADLVLLAMGFVGPDTHGMLTTLGVKMTSRGTIWRDERWMTSVPGVFTAGDAQRGQSLVVWAIAEGRSAARAVDEYLMGRTALPAPLT